MTSSVALFDALTSAPDERARARLIAEAFEGLDERYPHLSDLATQAHLRESELRLRKEIEQIRADLQKQIEQVRAELRKDIEQVRAELRKDIEQVRVDLKKDLELIRAELRADIEGVRAEIARAKIDLLKWLVPLMLAQVGAIGALVALF